MINFTTKLLLRPCIELNGPQKWTCRAPEKSIPALGAPKVRGLHNPPFHRSRPEEPEVVHGAVLLEDYPRRDRNRGWLQRGND